jgi:hypothetical protein
MTAEDQPSAAPPAENGVAPDNKNKQSKVDKRKEKKKRQKQNKQQRRYCARSHHVQHPPLELLLMHARCFPGCRQQQAQGQPSAGADSQQVRAWRVPAAGGSCTAAPPATPHPVVLPLLLQDEDDEQVIVEYVTEQPALDFLQPEEQPEDEEEAYGQLLGLGAPGLGLGATPKPAPPVSSRP